MRRDRGGFQKCFPICVIVAISGLSACSSRIPVYAPPAQFVMPAGSDPQPEVRFIKMNDLDAKLAVLEGTDNSGTGDVRRWTTEQARFQFRVASLKESDLYLRFVIPDVTFRQTGPVRISIDVNGKPFDAFIRTAPGEAEYRHAADGIAMRPFDPLVVSIRIDPPYIAEADHAKLGFLLNEIGFVPRGGRP